MPDIDPKTFIYYPLGLFIALAVLSIFFEIPTFVVFLVLFVVVGYFALLVYFELFNK